MTEPDQGEAMSEEDTRTQSLGSTCRDGSRRGLLWFVLSVVSSAVALAAVGCVCALLYPVIQDLRSLRVQGEDVLGVLYLCGVLFLSLTAASVCGACSWLLTHLGSSQTRASVTTPVHVGDGSQLDYGMAALNGIMAMFTVIWSLT